jgi:hypothetical protein
MQAQTVIEVENIPASPDEFIVAIDGFAAAFGKTLSDGTKLQYYRALGGLKTEQLSQLFTWAVETIDSPLPSIARLRRRVVELGWLEGETSIGGDGKASGKHQPTGKDKTFMEVLCPRCRGTFVVRTLKLAEYARAGVVFECANRLHWGCPVTFRAAELVGEEVSHG